MKPHVRAQTLARFRQGDLGPRRSARIGAHLARCARCQARSEDLAGVTKLLASVQPPPIPEHLEARIHSALTTEAARRVKLPEENAAAAPPAGPAVDGQHSRRGRQGHGRRPRVARPRSVIALRALAAAAAVVVVAGGIYEIAHNSASSSSAGSSAAAPAASATAGPSRAAAGPLATGPVLPYRHAGGEASITPVMTGTDFASATLSSQVTAQLVQHAHAGPVTGPNAPPATQGSAAAGGRSATFGHMAVADLAGCVNRIAAGDLVLLVDVARYQGGPATVIVTQPSAGGPEQIWVVGPGCSASRSDVLRHAALSPAG